MGGVVAQRQLHGVPAAAGARRGCSATTCASTPTRPKGRNCWRRSSWAAGAAAPPGARPGRRRSGTGRRPDAQQRLRLQGDGSARLRVSAGITCASAQSARHRPQHEPSPDDPPRCNLRTRPARRCARRRRGPRDRRVHHLRRPGAPVRVRPERLDQRQDLPRTRQRARPDLRHPGRRPGLHRPEAADPEGAQGDTGFHDAAGRRVLLPSRDQRTAIPRHARQIRRTIHGPARTYNQAHVARAAHRRAAHQHLLDVELSLGSPT